MSAPGKMRSDSQIALRRIRCWGRVVSALAGQLAKSPQNVALAETMLQSCDKLRAAWNRARRLIAEESR